MNIVSYLYYSLPHLFLQLSPQKLSHILLMVGLCVCISLGVPFDAPVDVLHGDPRFMLLSDSLSDVAIPESSDES